MAGKLYGARASRARVPPALIPRQSRREAPGIFFGEGGTPWRQIPGNVHHEPSLFVKETTCVVVGGWAHMRPSAVTTAFLPAQKTRFFAKDAISFPVRSRKRSYTGSPELMMAVTPHRRGGVTAIINSGTSVDPVCRQEGAPKMLVWSFALRAARAARSAHPKVPGGIGKDL